jgi:O-antigen/teichoic acid export membrane protein
VSLTANNFVKSVIVLLGGTAVAQLLNVAFTPLLTRIYSPDELGNLNYYLRIVFLLAALITLRLEYALPLEKYVPHRTVIFRFVGKWALRVSVLSIIPIAIILIMNSYSATGIIMLAMIPIGAFLHAAFNMGLHWHLSDENYSRISLVRLTQSLSTNGLKVFFGLANFGVIGLILSVLLGLVASNVLFLKGLFTPVFKLKKYFSTNKTGVLVHRHRDLTFFNLPHVALDLLRDLLLAVFIMEAFNDTEYGLFDHSFRMLKIPLVLLGAAVGQVLFTKCSQMVNDKEALSPLILKVVFALAGLGVLPFVLIYLFGTEIFSFVFSEKWAGSGSYGEIITIWIFVNFIVSPLSYLPIVLNRQRSYFFMNIINTIGLTIALLVPYSLNPDIQFKELLVIVSIVQAALNFTLILYFVGITRAYDNNLETEG